MRFLLCLFILFMGCTKPAVEEDTTTPEVQQIAGDCSKAKNTCADYSVYWEENCSSGRCIEFRNSCTTSVAIAYQIGCNGDGTRGAPQCDCTNGPILKKGDSYYWKIVDGNYQSCIPSWMPPCLTAGFAVMANPGDTPDCTQGSRIEFSAGNQADPYGKFDSYNLDIENGWYSIPVTFKPDLTCAVDHAAHDCRQVWCNSDHCPDAYADPTSGGCADGRSPQVGCQDTFNQSKGFVVEFCPEDCSETGGDCPSCQGAKACD